MNARAILDDGRPFALINGDTWMERDLTAWAEQLVDRVALLVVRQTPEAADYGTLGLDRTGRIVRILDWHAPAAEPEVRQVMFCGTHVLTGEIFRHLKPEPSCIMRTAYRSMLEAGLPIGAVEYDGPWFDIGTPERLAAARRALENENARW